MRDLVTTTLFENFLPVRLSWAAWQSLLLANSMNTLPQPEKKNIKKLTKCLSQEVKDNTRDFNSWHRPRDLYGLDLTKLAALLPDVFQDVLIFLLQLAIRSWLCSSVGWSFLIWWNGNTPRPPALLQRPCWEGKEPQLADQDLPCLPFQAPGVQ